MDKDKQGKRKFHYKNTYNNKVKKFNLQPGLKGFLCSCNFNEKDCVRESYNILNKYTDLLFKEPEDSSNTSTEKQIEIEESLDKEINELKSMGQNSSMKRFQVIDSGAKNFLFISTTLTDPAGLVNAIIQDIFTNKEQQTRYLLRLIPVEITCKANVDDIKNAVRPLLVKYFIGNKKTFSILFNHRNNNSVSKDDVIKEVADMISGLDDKHPVNLKEPDLSVIIEIIRSFAFISIVPDYFKFKKYNLLSLCDTKEEQGRNEIEKMTEALGDNSEKTEPAEDSTEKNVAVEDTLEKKE